MIEYVKVDLTSPNAAETLAGLEAAFKAEYPANVFSVNRNENGTFAWCKAVSGHNQTRAVTKAVSRSGHSEVLQDCYSRSWNGLGSEPAGGRR